MVQLLTPDGQRVPHPDFDIDPSDDELRALYRDLVLVRRIDNEATALQRQGELGLWAPCLGQEAAQVGSGRALRPQDYAFPSYREHGVAWCRGVDPVKLTGMFRGVSNGGWDPNSNNFHLYTIVIGNQALHATGYAWGLQRDGLVGNTGGDSRESAAVITYFGDGGSSQGDIHEAMVFASTTSAPVVFFCQNNQWAISEPMERQSRVPLFHRSRGYGFPGVRVDGNDVLAVLAVTRAALQHAREGNGPYLIEAYTYRMGAHTTSDDPTRYRIAAEVEQWRSKDPIDRLRKHLESRGLADQAFLDAVEAESETIAVALRDNTRGLPDPEPLTMFDNVYVEPHALVDEERAQYASYLASFEGEGH